MAMIPFKKIVESTTYLDPFSGFAPHEGMVEIRWDPLTRLTSRVVRISPRKTPRFNYQEAISASLAVKCPFCPENVEMMTARLPREIYGCDRLEKDGVTIIPNLLTFDKYALVAILSPDHFVDLSTLVERHLIVKAIKALLDAFRMIRTRDRDARYFSINCNFMPMAGSSILHSHLQGVVGKYPTNYLRLMLNGSKNFFRNKERLFWETLIEEEREAGERFIGTVGRTHWYAPFAPRGSIDVGCIFEESTLFTVDNREWENFGSGLARVFRYLDQENVSGFNLVIFSGSDQDKAFRVNARLVARRFLPPVNAADANYFDKLHLESTSLVAPENVAAELRSLWGT
jgi:UDPglucose--hexose-1-phosphate uridylyltransferase